MKYKVYGDIGSGAATVEATLAEMGVPYEVVNIDIGSAAQRQESYAEVNPHRKVPTVISPDGEILTESVAILLTLAERHPEAALLPPPGSPERARALRWLLFVATELYPIVEINDYPERFAPSPDTVDAVREKAREIWRNRWLIVENAIVGDPWLLVSGFCLTDIYISVVSRWDLPSHWRTQHIPKIEALTRAVAEREAAGPVWQRHFA